MDFSGGLAGHNISASFEKLMDDASGTADYFLRDAIKNIDQRLGQGYAAKHPELIAAYMHTAAQDSRGAYMKLAAQDILEGLREVAQSRE